MYGKQFKLLTDIIFTVKLKREKDLECAVRDDVWETICEDFSFNIHHKLIQFSTIQWVYFTPERLPRINNKCLMCCSRCKVGIRTLLHMIWSCLEVENYWKTILDLIMELTSVDISSLLKLTLLGDESMLPDQKGTKRRFIDIALLAAKKALLLYRNHQNLLDFP